MANPFSPCPCSIEHLDSSPQQAWMRFFPWLKPYRCRNCGKSQLLPQRAVERALASLGSRKSPRKGGAKQARAL
ncbi:hypothetical protein [Variovorax sp.]|jgi:hypothetical protein|uniref:hypothetical protein n=1 Tax=Variovorax TaxID=34072 RepID=UPI00155F008A|nr:hypothetical protein [Variovorax sp.]MCT8179873.1 hypothetical protein [Variovorax sp. CY25R-8]